MYSASTELSATDLYFLLYQEIDADPTLKIAPEVLFLSDGLPAQDELVKSWSFTPLLFINHMRMKKYYNVLLQS